MTDYIAIPPAKEVRGTVAAPPSKSATNRALILAALSETEVEIECPLESEDTRALIRCLRATRASRSIFLSRSTAEACVPDASRWTLRGRVSSYRRFSSRDRLSLTASKSPPLAPLPRLPTSRQH